MAVASPDLAVRTGAGLTLIAVALVALWLGGFAFWALATAAALLMLAEWGGLARLSRVRIILPVVLLALVLVYAAATLGETPPASAAAIGHFIGMGWGLAAAAALAGALLALSTRMGWGVLYAGLPTIGLLALRARPDGLWLTLWTLALVWATDIGAFFAGRAIGGPKLAPRLSPAKTWAGLVGGMIAAGIVGALIARQVDLPGICLWLGAPLAVLAQAGDLFESWLKRRAGVKDSGKLIPGHGGALDRLDGVVPVATVVAALVAKGVL